jgi:hypothetical protein
MMGPAGRTPGGPPAPPQGGWVGKQNYVWFRRRIPIIWQVFPLFVLLREMLRTSALSVYKSKDNRSASLLSYDI